MQGIFYSYFCSFVVTDTFVLIYFCSDCRCNQLREYQFSTDRQVPCQDFFEEQHRQEPCQELYHEQYDAEWSGIRYEFQIRFAAHTHSCVKIWMY